MPNIPCISLDRKFFTDAFNAKADLQKNQALAALHSLATKDCVGKEWTGWFHWPKERGFTLVDDVLNWANNYSESYDLIVVVGIGGSYLGAKAVVDLMSHSFAPSFGPKSSPSSGYKPIVFAGQNMSETALNDLLELMSTMSPIVNVISKSGTTTEPGVAFRVLRSYMESRYGKDQASRRIIATTDPEKGALRKLSVQNSYKTFEVPADVGGRYSVLSAVGLVPLALGGYDIRAIMQGADQVFQELTANEPLETPLSRATIEYAMCRTAAWNGGKTIEVVAYPEPRMRNFVEWFKQLFGESDGKQGKGLFPASLECTMDLHSLGQYMQDGARTMIETFLSIENPRTHSKRLTVPSADQNIDELQYLERMGIDDINQAAMLATRIAHSEGGVPCLELKILNLKLETVGALFAVCETSCAIGGLMLGINPFDQPGVEAYKVNLFGLLGKPGFEEIGTKLRQFSSPEGPC